ncbi:MAG: thiamine pyrophosphate-dependent enzyme [Candidatus Aminicenantales bacterium]
MAKLKDLAKMEDRLVAGHGMCLGCGVPLILKIVLRATEKPVIIANATGCLEVCTTIFPRTSWNCTWIHSAFENAASTIAGVEAMYKALKAKGRISAEKKIKFLAIGGDGGTYDIGLQALSGAVERGHDIVYLCYDNNAYCNTGGQRSSATPLGASATTSPAGEKLPGKLQKRKDLTKILVAHGIPYAAQASMHRWQDLYKKAQKAFETKGPSFLNVLCPCPTEWKYEESKGIKLAHLAAETCVWPVYEVEEGKYTINYKPKEKKPVTEWLKPQGRFRHLFREKFSWVIDDYQKEVDQDWEELNALAERG